MTFWLIAGAMTALTVGLLLWPLTRVARRPVPRRGYDLAVYRDQLAEVERDQVRGVLDGEQAVAARREIERRLLAAGESKPEGDAEPPPAGTGPGAGPGARPAWRLAAGLAVLLSAAALGLYGVIGAPRVPSLAFAERQAPASEPTDLARLVERLAQRMAKDPADPAGWALLGRTYLNLGRNDEAARAFQQAVARGDDSPGAWASLGEALTAASGGLVVAEARQAFAATLERDDADPRARYYSGLGLAQDGRTEAALEVWLALAADTPADAPWRSLLDRQIASSRSALGQTPAEVAPQTGTAPQTGIAAQPGPSAGDIAAAAAMTPEDRIGFIRSMVARLAGRLDQEPDDLQGWLRLSHAYGVLGEREKAVAALDQAARLTADLPAESPERTAVDQARKALDADG